MASGLAGRLMLTSSSSGVEAVRCPAQRPQLLRVVTEDHHGVGLLRDAAEFRDGGIPGGQVVDDRRRGGGRPVGIPHVHGVGCEDHRAGLGQVDLHGHGARGMSRRLDERHPGQELGVTRDGLEVQALVVGLEVGAVEGAHLKADYEGLDFETVSGDAEFLPGVTLIEAPGHTPGTMAMKVDLPETGTMIFTSDAVYMGDSYGPPAPPAAIVNDLSAWYASVAKLRGIAEQSDAMVIFGHDAEQLRSLRRAPDGFYA